LVSSLEARELVQVPGGRLALDSMGVKLESGGDGKVKVVRRDGAGSVRDRFSRLGLRERDGRRVLEEEDEVTQAQKEQEEIEFM